MKPFRKWMMLAPAFQKKVLAAYADTSVEYLYQLADGTRNASPDMAARIVQAASYVDEDDELPALAVGDLSNTCAKCPYFITSSRSCNKR